MGVEEMETYLNSMCPKGLALHHPAAAKLLQYATKGCPVNLGKPWTLEMMAAAIERGPHALARVREAIEQQNKEAREKEAKGQCKIIEWEGLKKSGVPKQLKILPLAMIPHKSRAF